MMINPPQDLCIHSQSLVRLGQESVAEQTQFWVIEH